MSTLSILLLGFLLGTVLMANSARRQGELRQFGVSLAILLLLLGTLAAVASGVIYLDMLSR